MDVDGQPVFNGHFPNPVEQAEALLEICQGDVHEAQAIATTNLKFAKYQADRLYWSRVEALISKQEPEAVMERLANCKVRRRVLRKEFSLNK
jgi:hypothetical protein